MSRHTGRCKRALEPKKLVAFRFPMRDYLMLVQQREIEQTTQVDVLLTALRSYIRRAARRVR